MKAAQRDMIVSDLVEIVDMVCIPATQPRRGRGGGGEGDVALDGGNKVSSEIQEGSATSYS